jgi:hypothetical protein
MSLRMQLTLLFVGACWALLLVALLIVLPLVGA